MSVKGMFDADMCHNVLSILSKMLYQNVLCTVFSRLLEMHGSLYKPTTILQPKSAWLCVVYYKPPPISKSQPVYKLYQKCFIGCFVGTYNYVDLSKIR